MNKLHIHIKKILLNVFLLLFSATVFAQISVDLEGISNKTLKKKIETNLTSLFNKVNQSFTNQLELISFENVDISDDAKIKINGLWATSPFKLNDYKDIFNLNSFPIEQLK